MLGVSPAASSELVMSQDPFERLKKARIAAGFQHGSDAAKRFGWKVSTYTAHENGQNGFGLDDCLEVRQSF